MTDFLKIILLTVVVKQLVWMAFIPIWQFPDEQAHFGQVAYLATGKPHTTGNNLTAEILISERILGTERDGFGNNRYTYHPQYNIPYSNSAEGYFEKEITSTPKNYREIMVKTESTSYPPLYYLPGTFVYKLINTDLFTSVFTVRLLNIFYSLIIVWFAYKIFSLIFTDSKFIFLGLVLVSFQPMLSYLSAGVSSDNIYNALSVVIIYLCLLILKDGFTFKYTLLSAASVFLSLLAKPQAYILILFFISPVLKWLITGRKSRSKIAGLFTMFLLSTPFLANYLIQTQYFPEVNLQTTLAGVFKFPEFLKWSLVQSYRQTLPWYWGVFRWLSLGYQINIYRVINIVTAISFVGILVFLYQSVAKKIISFQLTALLFFIYTFIIYFFSLTIWDFSFFLSHGFSFGIQGRYYFPLLTSFTGIALTGIQTLTHFSIKISQLTYFLLGLGAIAFHEYALYKIIVSYYNFYPLNRFFLLASQYKPHFIKSPVLIYLLLIHLISILLISILYIKYAYKKSIS